MFAACFVLGFFEGRVADEYLALLAPEFGLRGEGDVSNYLRKVFRMEYLLLISNILPW